MKKSICFVAHNAYGALAGGSAGHVGGVERQTKLMGSWLISRGYSVTVLTWDEGQPGLVTESDGLRVIKMCRKDAGLPGLRFIYPRWTSLNFAMRLANADLYYHNLAEYVTGQVALWCRLHGRRFVYSVASDPDCDRNLPVMKTKRERVLYRYALKTADKIVVQTGKQRDMLLAGFGRDSTILPMPCPGPLDANSVYENLTRRLARPCKILWVGRIARLKRLELFLDVAAALPELQFEIACAYDSDDSYCTEMMSAAGKLSNVTVHGRVPWEEMPRLYRDAWLLCCTSEYEGFPNTFLEAWSHGVPVVSTVDPDGLIKRQNLGEIACDKAGFVRTIRALVLSSANNGNGVISRLSKNARRYFEQNHAIDHSMDRFSELFTELLSQT